MAIRISILFGVLASVGCASTTPDLYALYGNQANVDSQPPLVLLHGVFGARLRNVQTGDIVWPGSNMDLVLPKIDPKTLEPQTDDLEVAGLAAGAAGIALDDSIVKILENVAGYQRAAVGQEAPSAKAYYVFTYDWRQDNIATVRRLADFLEQVRTDHADPNLRVDIVAHGMGGLIVRYFLRYGTLDVLDDNEFPINSAGAGYVRRVILLGTPNLGTMEAVRAAFVGFPTDLGRIPAEAFITWPSIYQLFPHPISSPLLTPEGDEFDADIFDVGDWRRFQWALYDPEVRQQVMARFDTVAAGRAHLDVLQKYAHKHSERGRRFVWSLTVQADEPPAQYILMGGSCELTLAKAIVEKDGGKLKINWRPKQMQNPMEGIDYERLMLQPGDGTVTKASLLAWHVPDPTVPRHRFSYFPLDHVLFLCEDHDRLTANYHFQDNLLNALLSADPI